MYFDKIGCDDFVLPEGIINVHSSELNTIRDLFAGKVWVKVLQSVSDINETWSCPVCSQPKWEDMVGCDKCDDWYHWECVSDLKLEIKDLLGK